MKKKRNRKKQKSKGVSAGRRGQPDDRLLPSSQNQRMTVTGRSLTKRILTRGVRRTLPSTTGHSTSWEERESKRNWKERILTSEQN